jgi:hypothetical protein
MPGVIELTDRAKEVLAVSAAAARRLNPDAQIRLFLHAGQLRTELTEAPGPGDHLMEVGGVSIIVQDGIRGTVDAGDHNVLSVHPA